MEVSNDTLHEIIKEELLHLGVQESHNEVKKSFFHHNGARLFGFTSNYLLKPKNGNGCESPKHEKNGGLYPEGPKTPKIDRSKSPFSRKNRLERKSARKSKKEKEGKSGKAAFGCDLDKMELCSAELWDGTAVLVPEFILFASSIICQNISIEGIFRKAGSTQRQNELKKLLDSGYSLPTSVHPIDAACLWKQFLRSLPTPLLPHNVHLLMLRCLELPKDAQIEALTLCSLLLTKPHQDFLAFMLELMSRVAAASEANQMDAHNLAIVLAPNLIPSPGVTSTKRGASPPEDFFLAATIDLIQALIEGAAEMCRPPIKLIEAVRIRALRSSSADNLLSENDSGCGSSGASREVTPVPPTPAITAGRKAKRRSASIHRLVNGLRRVVHVGVGATSSWQSRRSASPTPTSSNPPGTDGKCVVRMTPDIDLTPLKKTTKRKSDEFDLPVERTEVSLAPRSGAVIINKSVKKPRMELKVGLSEFFAPSKGLPGKLSGSQGRNSQVQSMVSVTARFPTIEPKQRRSLSDGRESSLMPPSPLKPRRKSCTEVSLCTPHKASSPNCPLDQVDGKKDDASVNEILSPTKEPHLGPRGAPDGAESSPVRPFTPWKSSPVVTTPPSPDSKTDPIQVLERRYDAIKSAVATMEREVDEHNLRALRDSYLNTPAKVSRGMSCSELIHDAYERMRAETRRDLNSTPSEALSKRLGKELRIRRRRGDDQRVIRSPSERRIGTLRRRSKELEQQQQQQTSTKDSVGHDPSLNALSTPKLKAQLLLNAMQSPQAASLKRGKPNSLRSGLPIVVSASETTEARFRAPLRRSGTPASLKTVCISKRSSTSSSTDSPLRSSLSSRGLIPLSTRKTARQNSTTSIFSSPIDRPSSSPMVTPSGSRRSSPLSSMDSSRATPGQEEGFGDPPPMGCSLLLSSSGRDLSAMDSSDWVPATEFLGDSRTPFRAGPTPTRTVEVASTRPSIAALTRQRKVTANVRLFSRLEDPRSLDARQTPLRRPGSIRPHQERRLSRTKLEESPPLQVITRRQSRKDLFSREPPLSTGSVVSPLRERNSLLTCRLPTPKIKSVSSSRGRRGDHLKAPSNVTPLPPRPYRPPSFANTPKTPFRTPISLSETPPLLPPRPLGLYR